MIKKQNKNRPWMSSFAGDNHEIDNMGTYIILTDFWVSTAESHLSILGGVSHFYHKEMLWSFWNLPLPTLLCFRPGTYRCDNNRSLQYLHLTGVSRRAHIYLLNSHTALISAKFFIKKLIYSLRLSSEMQALLSPFYSQGNWGQKPTKSELSC